MGIDAATDRRFPDDVSAPLQAGFHLRNSRRDFGWMLHSALVMVVLSLFCAPGMAHAKEGKEYFKSGKCDLDAGRYKEAVKKLSAASKDLPLLEDYSLLYLSTAYHELGDHKKSLDAVHTLIQKYPGSPLLKKARSAEIREAREIHEEKLLPILASFVKDFPDDEEMNVMYGFFLKQSGDIRKSKEVFKGIYMRAGPLSQTAYAELDRGDIGAPDLIERAANLMKKNEFKEAERVLRRALELGDGKNTEEILRGLGLSLFRQKEYREAARIFERIGDLFSKTRSLYRAGDKPGFESALKELLGKKDRRIGGLLIALAGDKRREGDVEGALKIYNDVAANYPSDAEEAMWGIGWTEYRAGEYQKSAEVFSGLYAKYEDPKYLYWQARSAEESGEEANSLYGALSKYENNFYSSISAARGKIKAGSLSGESSDPPEAGARRQFERADTLLALNMTGEANAELRWIARKIETPLTLVATASRFQKIGDYKQSINLVTKMPYSERLHRFWYPLAFWDDVERASRKHDIDPMIALSVMREESRFDPDARSVAGARGLMQLMPQTAYRLDKNIGLGISRDTQINDVRNNIFLGVYYLKSLFKEFKSLSYVLAAYNAGEFNVKKWQQCNHKAADEFIEDIPYSETRNYVKKVMTSYFQYRRSAASESASAGFLFGSL